MNWSMRLTLSTRSSCAQWVMARRRLSVTWSMSIDMLDGAYGQVDSAVVDLCSIPSAAMKSPWSSAMLCTNHSTCTR